MEKTITNKYEDLSTVENRVRYLLGARLRDRSKLKAAMERQDQIRRSRSVPKDWDSTSEIRKWREAR